jgi:hypothetical protein
VNQQSAVTILGASAISSQTAKQLSSVAPFQQQKKQKRSRMSWLPVFSHQQKKHLKSSFASVGKQKEHKDQKTKQCETKLVSTDVPEREETIPEHHSPKVSWILGLREEHTQWRKSISLQLLTERHNKQFKLSSPQLNAKEFSSPQRTHIQQKCNALSRSPSPAELLPQQEHHRFLPVVSSVGTQRRNSMWALGSSKPSTLRFLFIWLVRASTLLSKSLLDAFIKH